MEIKQGAYREMMKAGQITAAEYPIPDPMKDDRLFGLYLAFYKLPWDMFVKDYDAFHKDPRAWKENLTGGVPIEKMDIPPAEDDQGPSPVSTDMAGAGKTGSPEELSGSLRNISADGELARYLKEAMISIAFSQKVVLAFEKNLGLEQNESPLKKLKSALETLKKNKAYEKILANLVIVVAGADELPGKLKDHIDDPSAKVFVFADARKETRQKLSAIEGRIHPVYIEDEGFERGAYYPIAQIVAIALAQYLNNILPEGDVISALKSNAGDINLMDLNIMTLRMKNGALIVRLLPKAKTLETGELIKRYAEMMPFLQAA